MAVYREGLNYGDMTKDAVEIGGSFILSGFAGRYVEGKVSPSVTPLSSTTEKIIAGLANNIPKVALYYIFEKFKLRGAASAVMGSVGFDALIRVTNQGINPASVYIKQYRVLQNMQATADWAERQRHFGAMPIAPDVLERQRRYGAMPFQQNPQIIDRQRRFGSMEQVGFMSEPKDSEIHKIFNMM